MVQPTRGPEIPKFFAGRDIFITGATGFMGKVLVERLLSTCPDIGRLYLLLRPQKELTPEKRLNVLKLSQVFEVVRRRCPHQLDKLTAVGGDLTMAMLGLSVEDMAALKDVSIVFHSAAIVKMNARLRAAVDSNLRPVIQLLDICDTLPNVQVFIYISTAYSNADRSHVEEKVYPPPMPLEKLMKKVEDEDLDGAKAQEFVAPKPNTYTFTKAMAEHVIANHEHANTGYSTAIFRPTIVVSSLRHPFPGWIENLNGPAGCILSMGKGFLRIMHMVGAARADLIPVDVAIDTLLAATRDTALKRSPSVQIYNCSSVENPLTWEQLRVYSNRHLLEHPLDNAVWVPGLNITSNRFLYKILEVLMQTMPCHIADFAMKLIGFKSRINLTRANQMVLASVAVLEFFCTRDWQFDNAQVRRLRDTLGAEDRKVYNLDVGSIVWNDQIRDFVKGIRKYMLKEKDQDLPAARRHIKKLCLLQRMIKIFIFLYGLRFLMQRRFCRRLFQTKVIF